MGKKLPKTKPSPQDSESDVSTMKSSTPLEKASTLTLIKKKRRYRGKKAAATNPADKLKVNVTSIKRPKEAASSNWQAFVDSGLAQSEKSTESKLKKSSSTTNKRFTGKRISLAKIVDSKLIDTASAKPTVDFSTEDTYVSELVPKTEEQKELTRCIAIDCEMVGVYDGRESVLARVSLVNQHGVCVFDKFVKPKEKVADYRTKVSGVRPSDLKRGEELEMVQKQVAAILDGRILVGHAVKNDLKVLMLNHPPKMIRDTSRFKPFRNTTQGRTPALKKLASEILGTSIQSGEHSSVEDAKATMQLYNLYQKEWEDHRLQKRDLRRKKAIEAAAGKHSVTVQKNKKSSRPTSSQLLDEFAAF